MRLGKPTMRFHVFPRSWQGYQDSCHWVEVAIGSYRNLPVVSFCSGYFISNSSKFSVKEFLKKVEVCSKWLIIEKYGLRAVGFVTLNIIKIILF